MSSALYFEELRDAQRRDALTPRPPVVVPGGPGPDAMSIQYDRGPRAAHVYPGQTDPVIGAVALGSNTILNI
jgi:hypothetical protein